MTEVVGRIREYASESETEDVTCCASQITWMTDDGLVNLAESRCGSVGQPFHQALDPVPAHTVLRAKAWEDLVWKNPLKLELESGIPRDRMLPCPVGHFVWEHGGGRETCHSTDGPCTWPKLKEGCDGILPVFLFDRRGPPGHLRKLTDEEVWVLQGRSLGELKGQKDKQLLVREGCRATGGQTAASLLLWAGQITEGLLSQESARAGMCAEEEGPEALAQILLWLRRWKRGEFGGKAGGSVEEEKIYHVNRWTEAWWVSMLGDSSGQ